LGTLVTATGPHAGDPGTPRLGLDPRVISQFHADGVFLLLGLTAALWFALRATDAPRRAQRAVAVLLAVAMAQGLIGYVQYFTGLPEVLVGAHLLPASCGSPPWRCGCPRSRAPPRPAAYRRTARGCQPLTSAESNATHVTAFTSTMRRLVGVQGRPNAARAAVQTGSLRSRSDDL
jgi:hypothetical protein